MRTFKKISGFVIVNVLVFVIMSLMLAQPSALKILIKEAQNMEYNTIIIGESHGETGYDPFVLSDETGSEFFNLSRRGMPVVNLSYILEESNIDKHYKQVIMDLDPSYWDDDHKGTFGTDTNLLFRLTGNRWFTYVKDILAKDNYNPKQSRPVNTSVNFVSISIYRCEHPFRIHQISPIQIKIHRNL